MHTLGYRFKPWTEAKSIADGPSILEYVRDTAREDGRRATASASTTASSPPPGRPRTRAGRSRPSASTRGETVHAHLRLPLRRAAATTATTRATRPSSRASSASAARSIHPQHWPEDLDYSGKRVVVIGSGATAVTLVPAMAENAAQVTMLQRSPTYVVSVPGRRPDRQPRCAAFLPAAPSTRSCAGKTCSLQMLFYRLSRKRPELVKKLLRKGAVEALPRGLRRRQALQAPNYNPWDQRLCLVPDGDLFEAISDGSADDRHRPIETFTENGIELESGAELEADVDRHRHRPQPALPRRDRGQRRRRAESTSPRRSPTRG